MELPASKIAVLVGDGYQEMGFWYPLLRFREEGADVTVIAPAADQEYRGDLGYPVIADIALSDAKASDYDAVILPGGAESGELLRFAGEARSANRIVGASAAAARALAAAGAGKTAMDDGAEPVVTDGRLVTARSADDLPAYFLALTSALAAAA